MFLVIDENTNNVLKFFWTEEEGIKYMDSIATKENWITLIRVAMHHEIVNLKR